MSAYQTKVLSTPQVIVDGVTIPIVPNSLTVRIPGDAKVRAMSNGRGSTQVVTGLNAETLIGHVKFEIAATAQNADRVRAWKQKMIDGNGMTVNAVEDGIQFPHQNMHLTKETEIAFKAEGGISCEFEGDRMF